ADVRDVLRRRTRARRLRHRVPHPESPARPLRRGSALGRVRHHVHAALRARGGARRMAARESRGERARARRGRPHAARYLVRPDIGRGDRAGLRRHHGSLPTDPALAARAMAGMAIGTLIGGLLQLLVQMPSLAWVGFRYRPLFRFSDPGLRQVLRLMGPATIGAAAVQVNVFVNNNFASYLGDGPVSWLNVAFRFMQLPIGLFGVAIGTVTLPVVSRYGARGDTAAL